MFYPKVETLKRFIDQQLIVTHFTYKLCDQRCIMCSQPPKNKSYDDFNLYKEAIFLMLDNGHLGITGGEPTLLKNRYSIFKRENYKK